MFSGVNSRSDLWLSIIAFASISESPLPLWSFSACSIRILPSISFFDEYSIARYFFRQRGKRYSSRVGHFAASHKGLFLHLVIFAAKAGGENRMRSGRRPLCSAPGCLVICNGKTLRISRKSNPGHHGAHLRD